MRLGPYPKDKLTYKGESVVEFQTPPQTDGLGTESSLKKGVDPISGVAILTGDAPNVLLLSVRLPAELGSLAPVIIQQVERNAQKRTQ